jgi:hypothetical protein
MEAKTRPVRLRTLLADYPHTAALKRGEVTSDHVTFDFAEVTPIWSGFQSMVRRKAFDVSEMAIVTYLIAKSFGKSSPASGSASAPSPPPRGRGCAACSPTTTASISSA